MQETARDKLLSILTGSLIAGLGAGAASLSSADWGSYGPLAGAVAAVGINAIRKFRPEIAALLISLLQKTGEPKA